MLEICFLFTVPMRRTLRADLTSEYLCHIINYMQLHQKSVVTPSLRPQDAGMQVHFCRCVLYGFSWGSLFHDFFTDTSLARPIVKRVVARLPLCVRLFNLLPELFARYIQRASQLGPKQVSSRRWEFLCLVLQNDFV